MARQPVESLLPDWRCARWRPDDDSGRLRLEVGRRDHLKQMGEQWPRSRPEDAPNSNWRWQAIFDRARIRVVGLVGDTVVFAFACTRGYLKRGPPRCLRLDYIEVSPEHRGRKWGRLALGLVAELALHKGCEALLLGALPDPAVLSFYRAMGARQDEFPIAWSPSQKDLVPLYCGRETLDALEGWTSEQREEV